MSNDAPINDTDHFTAKKRLVRELRTIVIVQVAAMCAVVLGLFLFGSNLIPNQPAWDEIHSLCGVLALAGMITFVIAAYWGSGKLVCNDFLPIQVRLYACSVWGFFPLFLFGTYLLLDKTATGSPILFLTLFFMLFFFFPFYSIIPQFFIARWLAKEAEDGTIQAMDMT